MSHYFFSAIYQRFKNTSNGIIIMTSTAKQLDEAKRLAKLWSEGKNPAPPTLKATSHSGHGYLRSGTFLAPQLQGVEVDEDATIPAGRETFVPKGPRENAKPVSWRGPHQPVGSGKVQPLLPFTLHPTKRAEERTRVEGLSVTSAELQTRLSVGGVENDGYSGNDAEWDTYSTAKQTKLTPDQQKDAEAREEGRKARLLLGDRACSAEERTRVDDLLNTPMAKLQRGELKIEKKTTVETKKTQSPTEHKDEHKVEPKKTETSKVAAHKKNEDASQPKTVIEVKPEKLPVSQEPLKQTIIEKKEAPKVEVVKATEAKKDTKSDK